MTSTALQISERNPLPRLFVFATISWVAAFAILAVGTVSAVGLAFDGYGITGAGAFLLGLAGFYVCQRDALRQSQVFGTVRRLRRRRAAAEKARQLAEHVVPLARPIRAKQPTRPAMPIAAGDYIGRHAIDTPTRSVRIVERRGAWQPVVISGGGAR